MDSSVWLGWIGILLIFFGLLMLVYGLMFSSSTFSSSEE